MKNNIAELFKIKNQTATTADIYFYGDIVSSWLGAWDETDQYPDNIKNILSEANGKDLNIYINSAGGSVFAGMAIYNMLNRYKGHKKVFIDGCAASIASVIALSGDEIIMPSNAYFMIHKPLVSVCGNADELRKRADILDKVQEGIIAVYNSCVKDGIDFAEIENMVNAETWLTGEETANYFNITLTEPVKAVACAGDISKFEDCPIRQKEINNTYKNTISTELELLVLKGGN